MANMMTDEQWDVLREEHEIADLRADICLGSPESFSLEEKKQICADMQASTEAIDAAMRADFETLPDFAKKELLDMLGAPGTPEREWWENILLPLDKLPGNTDDL